MSRPRRMLVYWVRVPGLWWSREHRAWTTWEDKGSRGASTDRTFRTARRAFGHADGLEARGFQVSVLRGRRGYLVREWANCDWWSREAEQTNLGLVEKAA